MLRSSERADLSLLLQFSPGIERAFSPLQPRSLDAEFTNLTPMAPLLNWDEISQVTAISEITAPSEVTRASRLQRTPDSALSSIASSDPGWLERDRTRF